MRLDFWALEWKRRGGDFIDTSGYVESVEEETRLQALGWSAAEAADRGPRGDGPLVRVRRPAGQRDRPLGRRLPLRRRGARLAGSSSWPFSWSEVFWGHGEHGGRTSPGVEIDRAEFDELRWLEAELSSFAA